MQTISGVLCPGDNWGNCKDLLKHHLYSISMIPKKFFWLLLSVILNQDCASVIAQSDSKMAKKNKSARNTQYSLCVPQCHSVELGVPRGCSDRGCYHYAATHNAPVTPGHYLPSVWALCPTTALSVIRDVHV